MVEGEKQRLAEALAEFRIAKADEIYTHPITSAQWYKNVPGAGGVTISPDLLTVSSDLFRIVATAKRSQRTYTVNVVVKREKEQDTGRWICKTLIWQVE